MWLQKENKGNNRLSVKSLIDVDWVSHHQEILYQPRMTPTLKRFFIFHFVFPFLLCGFLVLHIFNLHFLSSNNPLRNSTNNKIPFFPFIISKDFYGNILILYLYLLQIHFGFSSLNSGFIILFTSILLFFYFMRSVSMSYYFIIFTSCRFNSFYLWFWFLSLLSFVWIGGQFPQDNFLSYGRILTLYYYFLLICILFSLLL